MSRVEHAHEDISVLLSPQCLGKLHLTYRLSAPRSKDIVERPRQHAGRSRT